MNFLLSANNLYILPVTVCITSILENHKNEKVSVYIFQNDFTEKNKDTLNELGEKYQQNIFIIKIQDYFYNQVAVLRWSKETYYRLLINEFLPKDLDRILYLDCDIIVNKNIERFYNQDFKDFSIFALPEKQNNQERIRLGLENGDYFQAGVLLFNLEKMRPIMNYEKSLEIINNLGDRLKAVDQDVINVAFNGRIKSINKKFNNMGISNFNGNNWQRLFNKVNKKEIEETYVFHYATGKPWNNLFAGSCEQVWYKYLRLSPFAYLYQTKFSKLKYKIFRTGIVKVLFYGYIHITPIINNIFLRILSKERYNELKNFYRKHVK